MSEKMALIVGGMVVRHLGLDDELASVASVATADLGMGDAPEGLSVWTGEVSWSIADDGISPRFHGAFRPLTEMERVILNQGGNPLEEGAEALVLSAPADWPEVIECYCRHCGAVVTAHMFVDGVAFDLNESTRYAIRHTRVAPGDPMPRLQRHTLDCPWGEP